VKDNQVETSALVQRRQLRGELAADHAIVAEQADGEGTDRHVGMQGLSDDVGVCALRGDESSFQGGESIRGLAGRVLYVYSSKGPKHRQHFGLGSSRSPRETGAHSRQ